MLGDLHAHNQVEGRIRGGLPQVLPFKIAGPELFWPDQQAAEIHVAAVQADAVARLQLRCGTELGRHAAPDIQDRSRRDRIEHTAQHHAGRCKAAYGILIEKLVRVGMHAHPRSYGLGALRSRGGGKPGHSTIWCSNGPA